MHEVSLSGAWLRKRLRVVDGAICRWAMIRQVRGRRSDVAIETDRDCNASEQVAIVFAKHLLLFRSALVFGLEMDMKITRRWEMDRFDSSDNLFFWRCVVIRPIGLSVI